MSIIKDVLGVVSPLYGAVTGRGMTGQLLNPEKANKIAMEEAQKKADQAEANRQAQFQQAANASRSAARNQLTSNDGGLGYSGYKKGGKVSSASKRADGIAKRGRTKGKIV